MSYVNPRTRVQGRLHAAWGQRNSNNNIARNNLTYQFNNGIPNQVSLRLPFTSETHVSAGGIYSQDRWTIQRLTVNLGLRWDYFRSHYPSRRWADTVRADAYLTFPEQDWASFNDITPKLGAAYDVFGTGKTAVKVSLSKYVDALSYGGTFGDSGSPTQRTANQTARTWNDLNSNFVPDCILADPAANGECSQFLNPSFGRVIPATNYDPDC